MLALDVYQGIRLPYMRHPALACPSSLVHHYIPLCTPSPFSFVVRGRNRREGIGAEFPAKLRPVQIALQANTSSIAVSPPSSLQRPKGSIEPFRISTILDTSLNEALLLALASRVNLRTKKRCTRTRGWWPVRAALRKRPKPRSRGKEVPCLFASLCPLPTRPFDLNRDPHSETCPAFVRPIFAESKARPLPCSCDPHR